jgi:hypothetical protein
MKNLRLEEGLVGDDNWPNIGIVKVLPDPQAAHLPEDLSEQQREEIVQSWKTVAVLKVSPITNVRVGYIIDDTAKVLKYPIHTLNGMFGMRVGARPVKFFVVPEDFNTALSLELIEVTKEDNSKYSELPVY